MNQKPWPLRGAMLITSAADVIDAVRPIMGEPTHYYCRAEEPQDDHGGSPPGADDPPAPDRARIVALLGPAPVGIDDIIRMSGSSPAIVRTVLLELELAGRLERHGGGLVSLV